MSAADDEEEYFRAIEEEFVRRRGAALLLSPKDWALIGSWRADGVPLRVVLQSLANVFDAFAARGPAGRRINSLSYCRQEVQMLHHLHAAVAGRDEGEGSVADARRLLARHLGRLQRRLRQAMTQASEAGQERMVEALGLCTSELKRLRADARSGAIDAARLDAELHRLDRDLLDTARSLLAPDALRAIELRAESALAAERPRMTPRAYDETRAAFIARALREGAVLPRLTLFD